MKRGEFPFQDKPMSARHEKAVTQSVFKILGQREVSVRRVFLVRWVASLGLGLCAWVVYRFLGDVSPEVQIATAPEPSVAPSVQITEIAQAPVTKQVERIVRNSHLKLDNQTIEVLNFDPILAEKADLLAELDFYKSLSILERWSG